LLCLRPDDPLFDIETTWHSLTAADLACQWFSNPQMPFRNLQGITYNWNVRKLVFLKLTISTIRQYETAVDICIITNEPDKAREVLHKWQFLSTRVCEFDSKVEDEQYALVWKHREVFDKALSSGEGCCTCFSCQRQAVQPRHFCHAAALYAAANTLLTDSPRHCPPQMPATPCSCTWRTTRTCPGSP